MKVRIPRFAPRWRYEHDFATWILEPEASRAVTVTVKQEVLRGGKPVIRYGTYPYNWVEVDFDRCEIVEVEE